MYKASVKTKIILNVLLIATILIGFVGVPAQSAAAEPTYQCRSHDQAWSFGVIADTQWTKADDGYNPNYVAANIIKQVDQQFIANNVKFVVAVGDTVELGLKKAIDTRALYAQDLYNAGIGFYPLRGNHEATEGETVPGDKEYLRSGIEMQRAFPQIGTGINNNTPVDVTTALIPTADMAKNPPAANTGTPFTVGTNFSAPSEVNSQNNSISYSFEYNNATFVLLDQFNVEGNYYLSTIPQQLPWIKQTLENRPANTHAFVFAHKNLDGGNHKDSLFGAQVSAADPGDGDGVNIAALPPASQPAAQAALDQKQGDYNAFITAMQNNKVSLVVSGHDHHHYASLVTSPDGKSQIHQLIAQSDASKFYTPVAPFSTKDAPIQQDLYRIGYYIFTVDGPIVTVDYYGDTNGNSYYGLNGGKFNFVKLSTMYFSLNGAEKLVPEGGTYAMMDNTEVASSMENCFKGTSMAILSGVNGSTDKTNTGRSFNNDVFTGWDAFLPTMASDTLSVRGMSKLVGQPTDVYTLSMTYVPSISENSSIIKKDRFGLLARDVNGSWVKAVSLNKGGAEKFVIGPWNASYGLGTYGVDPATNTAWAVINYNGDFVVGKSDTPQ